MKDATELLALGCSSERENESVSNSSFRVLLVEAASGKPGEAQGIALFPAVQGSQQD